jgi:hypothetical protein
MGKKLLPNKSFCRDCILINSFKRKQNLHTPLLVCACWFAHALAIGNFATTGHKLQGKTMANWVIAEWRNIETWAYLVFYAQTSFTYTVALAKGLVFTFCRHG